MKIFILLFSLVSFCIILANAKPVPSGGRVMVEDAAVGMSAGFTNTFSFSDEDNVSKDDESGKDEDVKNGSRDTNTHGIKNGGHSDVVKYSPQNGVDGSTLVNNNRIDPRNPNTTALINEWISLAKPPINATECAQTRYEAWGRMVGRTKGAMVIRASGKPDNTGGRSSAEYLWSMRDHLDSVDHCTLGEYVTAKLGNQSISHCKGRYKPKGPKANELLGEGRQYWNQGKLDQAIGHISEGKEHVCDDQQVNKTLSAMKKQKNDIDKRLKKTSSFIHNEKLDEAEKSLSKAAVISTKYERYIEVKHALEDARKKLHEKKIADIKKEAQEQAQKNADAREHEREEAQKEAEIKSHAEEERQREAENQRHIHEKADEARQRAREQAQKNADARENARIKAAEDKRRAQRKAEERRIARKKAEEARRRAQRKADAQRHAQRKADAQRRARRKAEEARKRAERRTHRDAERRRQAYIDAQRNEDARRRAQYNAQREAERRRNAQIKSQRDAAAFMNTMIKVQENMNASRHRQHTTPTHSHHVPTRSQYTPTYSHTKPTHTHKPAIPTGSLFLSGTKNSSKGIKVHWMSYGGNVPNWYILRREGRKIYSGKYIQYYWDKSVTPGRTYHYSIVRCNSSGCGKPSNGTGKRVRR